MEEMIRLQGYGPLWDEWTIDKLLYEGNLSNIYQVKNKDKIGVIKVIPVPKLQGETLNGNKNGNKEQMNNYFREVVEVLDNEVSRLSSLEGIPNVLTYKKSQAFERNSEIGFDYVLLMDKEQSLLEYVASKKVSNKDIVRIVKEVAMTLQKAHEEDVIHKDIKVENIFIGKNGESILGDFALARKVESYQSRSNRKVDNVYTAPEVMSEYDYSIATDVYALGMVLYLLLNNGQVPQSYARRTFKTEIPKPERAKEKLADIALKAISYRAKNRYSSAEEFYNALSALKEEDFAFPDDYAESEAARKKIQEEKERQLQEARKAEEERLRKEEEARKAEEERQRKAEEARKAEEERLRKEEEARKAEEERLRKEEEARKAEEERLRREEEARKAEEERLRKEEEARKAEEERLRKEEEARKAEEERLRKEEEARKAEEERLRKEEEARKAEEERLRREEEARKAEEERLRKEEEARKRAELIRMAEEERKKEISKQLSKEKDEVKAYIANTEVCQEGSLDGAAIQLDSMIHDMGSASMGAESQSNKQNFGYGSAKSANENKSASYFHEEGEDRKIEKAVEESQTLLGKMTEDNEKPEYEIHASAREYSGFFNFEETAAFEEKTTKKAFDKNMEQEPFEHKFIETPVTQKKVSKKPLVFIALLLLIIGAGTLLYCNEDTRTMIQNSYHKAVQYFEDKGVSSLDQKEVLAISKKEFTVTEYQIIRKEGAIEERKPLEQHVSMYQYEDKEK